MTMKVTAIIISLFFTFCHNLINFVLLNSYGIKQNGCNKTHTTIRNKLR